MYLVSLNIKHTCKCALYAFSLNPSSNDVHDVKKELADLQRPSCSFVGMNVKKEPQNGGPSLQQMELGLVHVVSIQTHMR